MLVEPSPGIRAAVTKRGFRLHGVERLEDFTPLFLAVLLIACPGMSAQLSPQPAPVPPLTAKAGAELFATSGCTQCHGPEGKGSARAPNIHDVRKRKTDDEIYTQIKEGKAAMPAFGDALSEDEIRSIVAFLHAKDGWKLLPPLPSVK